MEIELAKQIIKNGYQNTLKETGLTNEEMLKQIALATKQKNAFEPNEYRLLLKILKQHLDTQKFVYQDKKIGVIADICIGDNLSNWDYILKAYERFASSGIKNVLLLGNVLASYPKNDRSIEIYKRHLEELVVYYPTNFHTLMILGENDLSYKKKGIDIKQDIKDAREDFNIAGFCTSFITWNEYILSLNDKVKKEKINGIEPNLTVCGGSFYYQYLPEYNTLKVPSCSDIHPNKKEDKQYKPGFLILENKEKGIIVDRFGFENTGTKQILKRVIKKQV